MMLQYVRFNVRAWPYIKNAKCAEEEEDDDDDDDGD